MNITIKSYMAVRDHKTYEYTRSYDNKCGWYSTASLLRGGTDIFTDLLFKVSLQETLIQKRITENIEGKSIIVPLNS